MAAIVASDEPPFPNSRGARFSQPALVDGEVGVIVAPMGKLFRILRLKVKEGKIAEIDVTGDTEKFGRIDLAILQN